MTTQYAVPTQTPRATPPGPRGYPLLGVVPQFVRAPLECLTGAATYGPLVHLGRNMYLLNHPDSIKYVFQENHRNYDDRQTPVLNKLKTLLGNGLVRNEGESWLRQRRLMQPAFHRKRIAALAEVMTAETAATIERWRPAAEQGAPIDLVAEMTRLTMQIILKTMFGTDVGDQAETLSRAVTVTIEQANRRIASLIDIPESWPTPANRAYRRALATLDTFVYRIIDERRRSGKDMDDLLGMLLAARDEETGEGMSDTQLRDEVMTLFLAGHETTANALAWAWPAIAAHPEVERRLHEEVDSVLGGRIPTVQDLAALPYARMVFDETLRLYPAAWLVMRSPAEDDEIAGYHVPAKSVLLGSPYISHRDPAYWEDPETFDPERFTPERSASRPRYAYWPFGGGPRMCIGNNLALMEAQIIIAMVAQAYRLRVAEGQVLEPKAGVTLRPRYGVRMTVHPR